MNVMAWFDHETHSIWTQPWGRAIVGDLKGVELRLLPSRLTTWASWKSEHPQTLIMTNDLDQYAPSNPRVGAGLVLGVILEGKVIAYDLERIQEIGLLHDSMAGVPVLIRADASDFDA